MTGVWVTAEALAQARWEDAANYARDELGADAARHVYAERVTGTPLQAKLVAGARSVLARAAALSGQAPRPPRPASPRAVAEQLDLLDGAQ